ncbi:MAG: PEP-CTERM sorting domain-containing protein [Opitutaceae bacterium]|nr:PEP-CTERM sorting domain-containing protein [Opitutaceae bacterium]
MNIAKIASSVVVAAAFQAALSAEILVNGGFESPNPLAGWSTMTFDAGINAVSGGDVSPFGSSNGASTKAVQLLDRAGSYASPALYQHFSIEGPVRFSFDFRLSEFSSDYWFVSTTYHSTQSQGNSFPFNVRIGSDGAFKFLASGSSFVQPIDLGDWYRVVIDLDFVTQRLSGSLTEFGGARATWTDFRFLQKMPTVTDVLFEDYVSTTAKNGDLFLDNVSVTNSPAVPEPSTYGVVAIGALVVLVVRRRFGRKRG